MPYIPLTEIINDPFFNDVYDNKQDPKEKATVLSISYYYSLVITQIVNEEGKSVGSYDGERKIINDMKYALIETGVRWGYQSVAVGYRRQLTDALHHMMDGLKNGKTS